MNSNMITSFLETARCGSFSKAAEKLFFSQQTVSKQVAMLEKELGVSLFSRSGAGVSLTKEGEYYFTLFQHSRQNQKLLRQKINAYQEKMEKKLRIGCSEWILPYEELIPAILQFKEENSDLQISFHIYTNRELRSGLENASIDLGFFSEGHLPDRTNFKHFPICKEQICLVGPKGVVGEALEEQEREKRREYPFLIVPAWERSYLENKEFSRREVEALEYPPEKVHLISNFDSMLAMMRQKRYLAFSDTRFGSFPRIEGLDTEKLKVESNLQGCIPYPSENKYAPILLEYLKNHLNA